MAATKLANWIDGNAVEPHENRWLEKRAPHDGRVLYSFPASTGTDVERAVRASSVAFESWSSVTPVLRGQILRSIVQEMSRRSGELAECVALETGKSTRDAEGEVGGAIQQGEFFAGEGMRLYGRTLTSSVAGKSSQTIRQPLGVAGLIVPANTPIANIAWKVFPALICGNTAVLKAAENAPRLALLFAEICKAAGLPDGVLNVINGTGLDAGRPLVEHDGIAVLSFTGSTSVGRWIAQVAGRRLARVSLELGGKNPFVVCDDADLDRAVDWGILSAFSNAGQRCAAGSRIIVFDSVYEKFRDSLVERARSLVLGVASGSDLGPLISKGQRDRVLQGIESAVSQGGQVLCGGRVPDTQELRDGYYVEPTLIEALSPDADLNTEEIFGPVATLHRVKTMREALVVANATEYGLTAAIHTQSIDRAMWFASRVRAGVANINLGTYGSEPHMPFGGFGSSGNGTREPGTEALDVYSELKNISVLVREGLV